MSLVRTFGLAAVLVFAAGQALAADAAASLSGVTGEVVVSTGKGIAPARAGTALKAGDRVVAKTGQATLRYADGCVVAVPKQAMATVAEKSPCAGGPGIVSAGQGSAALGLPKWPAGAYVAGLGSAVIVGAIVYGLTKEPASP